jgi:hypothetical protein
MSERRLAEMAVLELTCHYIYSGAIEDFIQAIVLRIIRLYAAESDREE